MHEALRERRPAVTTAEAADLARDLFGLEVSGVSDLPGERDRNFRVEDTEGKQFVLKVMHPAEEPAVGEFQALALVHIAERDPLLPVPRVLAPLGGGPRGLANAPGDPPYHVRCVSWLTGQPLAGGPSGNSVWRELGRYMGRLDRALADFSHPADDHELLWDLKRADRARDLIESMPPGDETRIVAELLDRFEQRVKPCLSSLRMQVIHNDLNPHNVLVSPTDPDQVAGVIDFGDMIRAPLSQELATAAAYQDSGSAEPLEAAAQITAAYQTVNPLSEDEVAVIPDLIAVRLALSVLITSWRAALHPDEAGYILRTRPAVLANLRRLAAMTDGDRFAELVARLAL